MSAKSRKAISPSENMRRIKSKDTKIEIMLRKELWKRTLRYQKPMNLYLDYINNVA